MGCTWRPTHPRGLGRGGVGVEVDLALLRAGFVDWEAAHGSQA